MAATLDARDAVVQVTAREPKAGAALIAAATAPVWSRTGAAADVKPSANSSRLSSWQRALQLV